MKNEEQIREEIRRVLNQMMCEGCDILIRNIKEESATLTSQRITEIQDRLLSQKNDDKIGR